MLAVFRMQGTALPAILHLSIRCASMVFTVVSFMDSIMNVDFSGHQSDGYMQGHALGPCNVQTAAVAQSRGLTLAVRVPGHLMI